MAANILNETNKNMAAAFRLFQLDNLWTCRSDPRFCYYVYIPETVYDTDPIQEFRVLMIIHGSTRIIEDARYDYREFAKKYNVAVVAPLFPCGMFDPNDINGYKSIREGSVHYDSIVFSILEEIHHKLPNIRIDRFMMAGHSGGGQFVQRFFYLHPKRLLAISISAPGRPTYLDLKTDFYWGIRNFEDLYDKAVDINALRDVSVQLMVGSNDTGSLGESPYGSNRMERMKCLKGNFDENGLLSSLVIIPGIGHFDGDRERSAQNILFFKKILDTIIRNGE